MNEHENIRVWISFNMQRTKTIFNVNRTHIFVSFQINDSTDSRRLRAKNKKMMHPRLNVPLSQENPLWLSWHDTAWIAVLNPTNVMDYFMEKSNPFYDST